MCQVACCQSCLDFGRIWFEFSQDRAEEGSCLVLLNMEMSFGWSVTDWQEQRVQTRSSVATNQKKALVVPLPLLCSGSEVVTPKAEMQSKVG